MSVAEYPFKPGLANVVVAQRESHTGVCKAIVFCQMSLVAFDENGELLFEIPTSQVNAFGWCYIGEKLYIVVAYSNELVLNLVEESKLVALKSLPINYLVKKLITYTHEGNNYCAVAGIGGVQAYLINNNTLVSIFDNDDEHCCFLTKGPNHTLLSVSAADLQTHNRPGLRVVCPCWMSLCARTPECGRVSWTQTGSLILSSRPPLTGFV